MNIILRGLVLLQGNVESKIGDCCAFCDQPTSKTNFTISSLCYSADEVAISDGAAALSGDASVILSIRQPRNNLAEHD